MLILICVPIASFFLAMALRVLVRNPVLVLLLAAGAALFIAQLASLWFQQRPVFFVSGANVFAQFAISLLLSAIGSGMVFLLYRGERSDREAIPNLTPGEGLALAGVVLGVVTLPAPYLATQSMGSAPVATISPMVGAGLVAIQLAWLVVRRLQIRLLMTGLAFLACVATVPVLVSGPSQMMGQAVTFTGAWVLALASGTMLVGSLIAQITFLRDHGVEWGGRFKVLAITFGLPVLLLIGCFYAAITWSQDARIALHPSARVAFAEWTALNWNEPDSSKTKALQQLIRQRVQASPRWWSREFEDLTTDPDAKLRYAAVTIRSWESRREPLPATTQRALFSDPDVRVRRLVVRDVLAHRDEAIPVELIDLDLLLALYAESYVSTEDFLRLVDKDRVVEVRAELIMRVQDSRAQESIISQVVAAPDLFSQVIVRIAADRSASRRARALSLIEGAGYKLKPSPVVGRVLMDLMDTPGPTGVTAAERVLRMEHQFPFSLEALWQATQLAGGEPGPRVSRGALANQDQGTLLVTRALQGYDSKAMDGALAWLWRGDPEILRNQVLPTNGLLASILRIIEKHQNESVGQRAAALVLARQLVASPQREELQTTWERHGDQTVRALAVTFAGKADEKAATIIRALTDLMWSDIPQVRGWAPRLIARAKNDPEQALKDMEVGGVPLLKELAGKLRAR